MKVNSLWAYFSSVMTGDWDAAGALTRRRRATLTSTRSASLLHVNGGSSAVCQSPLTADVSRDTGKEKHDRALETTQSKSKNEKKKRRNDLSDRLR